MIIEFSNIEVNLLREALVQARDSTRARLNGSQGQEASIEFQTQQQALQLAWKMLEMKLYEVQKNHQ